MTNTALLDEAAEPMTLAAAETTMASPLAAVAAQPAPAPLTAQAIDAAAAATTAPGAAVTTPATVTATTTTLPTATPLGTLAPAGTATLPMLGALLLVVGLILALGKLVKKFQSRSTQSQTLQLKGGVQVGSKERVVWMQAGDTHLLLGVSPGRVQTLHVFDVAPDFAAPAANDIQPAATATAAPLDTPASRDFSDRLRTLLAHAKAKGLDIETAAAQAGTPVETVAVAPAAAPKPTAKPTFSFRA